MDKKRLCVMLVRRRRLCRRLEIGRNVPKWDKQSVDRQCGSVGEKCQDKSENTEMFTIEKATRGRRQEEHYHGGWESSSQYI